MLLLDAVVCDLATLTRVKVGLGAVARRKITVAVTNFHLFIAVVAVNVRPYPNKLSISKLID
jgi:hypothetical protein